MDRLTPEQRRKTMQAVKSKGSQIELKLGTAIWRKGYRYRKNNRKIFGNPDFTFRKYKIAIFCDSEFWHGKDWDSRKRDFKSHQDFWIPKIERNIQRDIEVNDRLMSEGWVVLRFWGNDIMKNIEDCIAQISSAVQFRQNNQK